MKLFVVTLLLCTLTFLTYSHAEEVRSKRFSIHDPAFVPKKWKFIHKSKPVSREDLRPPAGVKPDDYFKFIPSYVGSVLPGQTLSWSAPCFENNTATLTVNGKENAQLRLQTHEKQSFLCNDAYLFAYVGSFDITFFEIPFWDHTINWNGGWSDGELFDITNNGIRVFIFPTGIAPTAEEIFETMFMFVGGLIGVHVPEWTAEDNLKFLADHMGVVMEPRNITKVFLPEDQIQSGDFFGVIRLDGLDPMLAWGMGSHTGHTTIAMRIDNKLFICESTTNSAFWPTNGVQCTPYLQWLDQAEKADLNVVHLPLRPDIAKKFDLDSAVKFLKSVIGLPYGFHNLFSGWIDTPEDNYPPPLSSQLTMLIMPFGEWVLFKEAGVGQDLDFLRQGLNKRLFPNTDSNISLIDTYMEGAKRGLSFSDMVTIPEQDDWTYDDGNGVSGPSMVCNVLIMRIYKAAGLFGELTDQIQAGEFTNWDVYSLNFFDGNYKRPAQCVEADPDSQFCQILGKYRMSLPDYNTFDPYPHMRERCPSQAPNYFKPKGC